MNSELQKNNTLDLLKDILDKIDRLDFTEESINKFRYSNRTIQSGNKEKVEKKMNRASVCEL